MVNKILIVEDNAYKRDIIEAFLYSLDDSFSISLAESFSSGRKMFEEKVFDVAVLDMTLPTFDKTDTESGGKRRPFGGRELIRRVRKDGVKIPIIFLTQYDAFSSGHQETSIEELNLILQRDLKNSETNIVYFEVNSNEWKDALKKLVGHL